MTSSRPCWVALFCFILSGVACESRKEGATLSAPDGATVTAANGASGAVEVDCALTVPSRIRSGESVPVSFRLTNRMAQTLFVLNWRTPLEGLSGDDFQITRDTQELPYQGGMAKRGDPLANEYVALAPGASVDAQVDVSQGYSLIKPGHYRIAFRGQVRDATTKEAEVPRPLGQHRAVALTCPSAETELIAP